ncbi:MAG: winged helix-turn-helix transcriptional regulator [Desulfovibrionaceae bacterium]
MPPSPILRTVGGRTYTCSVELSLQILGGKWKPVILWLLSGEGGEGEVLRFGELQRAMPRITRKMLTQQLRELEADRLVFREVYAQVPPKVEYSLTDEGRSVLPVLTALREWGRGWAGRHEQDG